MANPQVPSSAPGIVNHTALINDLGGATPYATAGGAGASMAAGVVALEAAVGTDDSAGDLFTRVAAAETSIGTDDSAGDLFTRVAAAETSIGTDDSAGDLFTRVAAVETDLESAADTKVVDLGTLRLSTGAAIGAFADNTTDGFELSGSECLGIRWNDSGSSRITVAGELHIPADWDDTAAVTAHFEGFRVGSADAAMVGTVTAFAQEVGDAYTDDADAGGSTTAFDGATTVITDETLAFLAGVLPAGSKVSFTFTPDAALDGDDFVLTGIKFVGTRKMRTA